MLQLSEMFQALKINSQDVLELDEAKATLVKLGYRRVEQVGDPGEFSVRGGILDIYPFTHDYPLRVELDGNQVERIRSFHPATHDLLMEHHMVIILPHPSVKLVRPRQVFKELTEEVPIEEFVEIEPGDPVVHVKHGIGRFVGVTKLPSKWKGGEAGAGADHLVIEYANRAKLYVPASEMHLVQKYIGFEGRAPKLSVLGSSQWQLAKERVRRGITLFARELLELQARRAALPGHACSPDTDWQRELEASFPFEETPDQVTTTAQVKQDLEHAQPMDRLLCGDVGYGKTEVALRAAFKVVMDDQQVAVLVPTTLLAEQHHATFGERMKPFPVRVEMLSRFKSRGEQREIIRGLKEGSVDIVIGTHRLLMPDIGFEDLGLVIIDEEQRFGVRHKERLKQFRTQVDLLTLTATPIPRTLYLSLMGAKDISVIATPPKNRLPVETHCVVYDEHVIRQAITRELARQGQFFVVNHRIEGIEQLGEKILRLVPEARIAVAHGQMAPHPLERVMVKFMRGELDGLVCTTIVQSGIDIPNANTLIVNHAERFGLADLYQLRGRVGRFNRKAYAYFLVPRHAAMTLEAEKRLEAIEQFTALGSGFKIAMQDLQLRGAGNLLGTEQHGFVQAIGFDLYCRLLREQIHRLKTVES